MAEKDEKLDLAMKNVMCPQTVEEPEAICPDSFSMFTISHQFANLLTNLVI
jgi:hypothetical protein